MHVMRRFLCNATKNKTTLVIDMEWGWVGCRYRANKHSIQC